MLWRWSANTGKQVGGGPLHDSHPGAVRKARDAVPHAEDARDGRGMAEYVTTNLSNPTRFRPSTTLQQRNEAAPHQTGEGALQCTFQSSIGAGGHVRHI